MKAQIRLACLALIIAISLGATNETNACSCGPERPVCEAFGSASAVFVGQVIDIARKLKPHKFTRSNEGKLVEETVSLEVEVVRFAIEETFSGVAGDTIEVFTNVGGGSCGYEFKLNERYLVYAHFYEDELSTSICSRTRPLARAEADMDHLRKLPAKGIGARLYGRLVEVTNDRSKCTGPDPCPLARIPIVLRNAEQRLETVTDKDGRYEFNGVKPGEYRVQAVLPDYYTNMYETGHVYDRGCAQTNLYVKADGRISGRVSGMEDHPELQATVYLVAADRKDPKEIPWGTDAHADKKGRYEIKPVPPGRYVLGLRLQPSGHGTDEPYPRTFYPGVTDRTKATVINIDLGEKLADYDFQMPPKLAERTVQGVVRWPDGRPAEGAEVYLMDHKYPNYMTDWPKKTDTQGRFTLRGYEGYTYWIHANVSEWSSGSEKKSAHAEPPTTVLTQDVKAIELVLSSPGSLCKHYLEKQEKSR